MFGFTGRESGRIRRKPAVDLMARHRTVARVMIRVGLRDSRNDRLADLYGSSPVFLLHRVGAVVAGATLDHLNRRLGHELEHVARLESNVLHTQMAGHVVTDLA